jgi:tripartite motif-containing protein 71
MWGSEGAGDGQFNSPGGGDVDTSGNVYVADSGNNRVQKFDSNSNFITEWGTKGSNEGQFLQPLGVAVDSVGNVYVVDSGNSRIQVLVKCQLTSNTVEQRLETE